MKASLREGGGTRMRDGRSLRDLGLEKQLQRDALSFSRLRRQLHLLGDSKQLPYCKKPANGMR